MLIGLTIAAVGATARDDFPGQVKDLLAKRVAFECSRPGCGQVTSGPQADPARSVNVGVAAHITAASPDGPRYDPALSSEKRRSHENGIWLCQTCAKLVDNDPIRNPAELLRTWKQFAEERAARALEGESGREGAVRVFGRLSQGLRLSLSHIGPGEWRCVLMGDDPMLAPRGFGLAATAWGAVQRAAWRTLTTRTMLGSWRRRTHELRSDAPAPTWRAATHACRGARSRSRRC